VITRREALRRSALLLGGALSATTVKGVLEGCAIDAQAEWTPRYFSADQIDLLSEMADHLLPKTATPGAKDVLVHRFIDAFVKDYFGPQDQKAFSDGLAGFDSDCRAKFAAGFTKLTPAQRDEIFRARETESPPLQPTIWGAQITDTPAPPTFYRQFKELAITGYFTSEEVGKHLLNYDPVPGAFHGCQPVTDKTRVSALG